MSGYHNWTVTTETFAGMEYYKHFAGEKSAEKAFAAEVQRLHGWHGCVTMFKDFDFVKEQLSYGDERPLRDEAVEGK